MKYDPERGDLLPEGFDEATDAEQNAYWQSRARYFNDIHQREDAAREAQQRRSDERWKQIMRDIHDTNKRLSQCRHRRTVLIKQEATEVRGGVAIDAEVIRRCADCNRYLETVE